METERLILVVDDSKDILDAMRDILEAGGYKVITAEDGNRGLQSAGECHPDLIITDLVMPDMEGMEFITTLRKIHKGIPVIVMSGNTLGVEFLKSARIFGAKQSLRKPFSRAELLEAVESALS